MPKKRIKIAFSTIYPSPSDSIIYLRLARFEKEGLVKGNVEYQEGVPNKTVYNLTEAGFNQFSNTKRGEHHCRHNRHGSREH